MSPNPRVVPDHRPVERVAEPAASASERMAANANHPPKVTTTEAMALARHCMRFRDPRDGRAWRELGVTLLFYVAACAALVAALASGWWIGLVLAIPAGMAVVRVFTIQHDCGHGSFFSSRTLNTWTGRCLGVLTFTPYEAWRRAHAMHHAGSGDLGRRGIGDIDMLTVAEYRARGPWGRLAYRLYRHPLVINVIGPPVYFLLMQRWPWAQQLPVQNVWRSIVGLNVALVLFYGTLILAVGPTVGLAAVLAVGLVASWVGSWLFYVQHQFEDTHWDHGDEWEARVAALNGSSHYVLPAWVNWLTGNIALHHIHHLNARIPGYRLPECMAAEPRLRTLSRLTFLDSLKCIGLALWDEDERRLIRFRALRGAAA